MSTNGWDKVSAGLDGLVAAMMLTNRGGMQPSVAGGGTGGPRFFTSLLNFAVRVWEEKGGSLKDESEMLEAMFSGEFGEKSKPLNTTERKKIAAVLKAMSVAERNIFRVAIFIMNPETKTHRTLEVKDDKGKITPASEREEKTGVDPRINVLRGVAEMVNDDHSNVAEVAETLRDAGTLGGNNKALAALIKAQGVAKLLVCKLLKVESIDKITTEMLIAKAKEVLGDSPDLSKPPKNDNAGFALRIGRLITPGGYSSYAPEIKKERKPPTLKGDLRVIGFVVGAVAVLVICIGLLTALTNIASPKDDFVNSYRPTAKPAIEPVK